ncbi:MAG: ribonuclease HI, partial [Succinivibrionaceae bacterium]|nr:ribonuclease HI [Succinivibrionaceae bacterium]
VQNKELWMILDQLIQRHEYTVNWVKGHSGHPQNERCDELARTAASLHRDPNKVDKPRY